MIAVLGALGHVAHCCTAEMAQLEAQALVLALGQADRLLGNGASHDFGDGLLTE